MEKRFAAVLVIAGFSVAAQAQFNYSDFSSISGLAINGQAAQLTNFMRVAQNAGSQTGSFWFNTRQNIANGFDTTFSFRIADGSGADGMTFTIQNQANTAIGTGGSGMGWAGISNSVAVAFQTFQTHRIHVPGFSNGVAVGDLRNPNGHMARIQYTPGTLNVYYDDLVTPLFSTAINLPTAIGTGDGMAWVGFTAATGGLTDNHDVRSWSFTPVPEPATMAVLALGAGLVARRRRRA